MTDFEIVDPLDQDRNTKNSDRARQMFVPRPSSEDAPGTALYNGTPVMVPHKQWCAGSWFDPEGRELAANRLPGFLDWYHGFFYPAVDRSPWAFAS